jgi:hypothetical protein
MIYRPLTLCAPASATHNGGIQARTEIAMHPVLLLKMMQEDPDDNEAAELTIVIISLWVLSL